MKTPYTQQEIHNWTLKFLRYQTFFFLTIHYLKLKRVCKSEC